MLFPIFMLACSKPTTDSAEPQPKPVLVEITLLDAIQGDTMGNVTLTSTLDSQTTESDGKVRLLVHEDSARSCANLSSLRA